MRGRRFSLGAIALAILVGGCGSSGANDEEDRSVSPARSPIERGPTTTVAAAGDFGMEPAGVATLEAMAGSRPDLFLGLGDFSYAGPSSEGDFCELVRSKVGGTAPFEIVAGNHEEDPGQDGRADEFAACLPDRLDAVGEYARQYYFDVGELARFILISPDLTIDGEHYYYGRDEDGEETPQLTWLKETIAEARATGIRWVIVGMHKNCISVGEYYCDVYQDLFSTLIASKVDLILTGHDHTYQRSKQIATAGARCREVVVDRFDPDCVVDDGDVYRQGEGSVFLVVGTGGADLYPIHATDPEAGYFVTAMGRNSRGNRHGFAMLTLSRRRLAVRFVASTPGSFADRFAIRAR
jgi:3',5'-cyclic AMP phosphodiesterase CpdA